MPRPRGRQPKVGRAIEVALSDADARMVDQFCRLMNVGYSEFFHLLLAGAVQLAHESNERETRPMEGVR